MVSLLIAALLVVLGFFTGSVWAHVTTDTPSFTEWHWRPDVVIVVTLLSTAYVAGWRRLRKRNLHTVKKWQLLVYLTSMGMICLARLPAMPHPMNKGQGSSNPPIGKVR